MKISKLFHWLYAILMFLPFGYLAFNGLSSMLSGQTITFDSWYDMLDNFGFLWNNGVSQTIGNVYDYLLNVVFGFQIDDYLLSMLVEYLLTYWTCISIIWLVFDVFMYVPLLVHRWIDKAKIE